MLPDIYQVQNCPACHLGTVHMGDSTEKVDKVLYGVENVLVRKIWCSACKIMTILVKPLEK